MFSGEVFGMLFCRYYLADEPGGNGIDPALLEKAYDFVKVCRKNGDVVNVCEV